MNNSRNVKILYLNHRGETAWRHILPQRIELAGTLWYPDEQWLLVAYDFDKKAHRKFAMKNIKEWATIPSEVEYNNAED